MGLISNAYPRPLDKPPRVCHTSIVNTKEDSLTTSTPDNTPNTVGELLELNTPDKTDLERVQEVMETVGYEDTLTTVKWLVSNLLDFHTDRVKELEGEPNQKSWVVDQTHLWTVLQLLNKVS